MLEERVSRLEQELEDLRQRLNGDDEPDRLLALDDVAKWLGVSHRTVDRIIAAGDLKPIRTRGIRRFHPQTVDAYIRRRAESPYKRRRYVRR